MKQSKSILFIGTSFLGAIKLAYEAHFESGCNNAVFVGISAPDLAAHLKSGWSVTDGCLQLPSTLPCFVSGFKQNSEQIVNNATFSACSRLNGLDIDLCDYRKIIFVDMFYRLAPTFIVNEDFFPSIKKEPVSDTLLTELKVNGNNGFISLDANRYPRFGYIPFVNVKPLLVAIQKASSAKDFYLISAPRPPIGNINIQSRYGDAITAKRSFDYLEQLYKKTLAKIGIEYLFQPNEVLDDGNLLTRVEYSRGPHLKRKNLLDSHMNEQYGVVVLEKYSKQILEIDTAK